MLYLTEGFLKLIIGICLFSFKIEEVMYMELILLIITLPIVI